MINKDTSLGGTQERGSPIFISVLGYQKDGEWIAHALEMDLIGIGDTWEKAEEELIGTIDAHISHARDMNDSSLIFHPAPQELFEKYRQAMCAEMQFLVSDSRQEENLFRPTALPISPQGRTQVAHAPV